jgi:hypothetical protein
MMDQLSFLTHFSDRRFNILKVEPFLGNRTKEFMPLRPVGRDLKILFGGEKTKASGVLHSSTKIIGQPGSYFISEANR